MNELLFKKQKKLLEGILTSKVYGYGGFPIPCELDDEITEFIDGLMDMDNAERNKIKELIKIPYDSVFIAYAERMASNAVRKKSVKEISQGLKAIFFNTGIGDPRDDIIAYSLLYDATLKIGENPKSLFVEVAEDFNYLDRHELDDFLSRSRRDRSIKSMGFKRGSDKDGFRYLFIYNGGRCFTSLLFLLGEILLFICVFIYVL